MRRLYIATTRRLLLPVLSVGSLTFASLAAEGPWRWLATGGLAGLAFFFWTFVEFGMVVRSSWQPLAERTGRMHTVASEYAADLTRLNAEAIAHLVVYDPERAEAIATDLRDAYARYEEHIPR